LNPQYLRTAENDHVHTPAWSLDPGPAQTPAHKANETAQAGILPASTVQAVETSCSVEAFTPYLFSKHLLILLLDLVGAPFANHGLHHTR